MASRLKTKPGQGKHGQDNAPPKDLVQAEMIQKINQALMLMFGGGLPAQTGGNLPEGKRSGVEKGHYQVSQALSGRQRQMCKRGVDDFTNEFAGLLFHGVLLC